MKPKTKKTEEPKKINLEKKHIVLIVILLIGVFAIVIGTSYAFFSHSVTGKDYVVYSGKLEISYEKDTNVVNLQDTRPMTNAEGNQTTPYSFNVKNTGTIKEKYQVRLELSNSTNLPLEYVKVSVYKNDIEYLKPTRMIDLNSTFVIVDDGLLEATEEDNYKVRFWVDINAGNDTVGKTFGARVVIDAMQNVEEGYAVNTKPIITLNKDEKGNTDIYLEKNATYTELGVANVRDDKDVLKTSNVTITGNVDTSTVGIYPITYSITDRDNNTTTVIRRVIVNDGTLPVYKSASEVVNSFNQSDLREAIVCSHIYGDSDLYLDCEIKDTIENAVSARNVSTIILTSNITRNSTINIGTGKDIVIDVNNKTITGGANILYIRGGALHLTGDGVIHNGSTNSNVQNGAIKMWGSDNTKFVIDGGKCDSLDINTHTTGLLIYSDNQNAIANYGANTDDGSTAEMIINGGCYYSGTGNGIVSVGRTTSTINDADVIVGNYAVYVSSLQTNTEIEGGTYISNNASAIFNNGSTSTINITQTDKPIYIKTVVQSYNPAIINNSTGIINIKANQANVCTANANDTTSGLCVYAVGNGGTTTNDGNAAVRNFVSGTLNADGGTYIGGRQGFNNQTGITNIKNSHISSAIPIENWGTGTTNICSSTILGSVYDIQNGTTGSVVYSTDVIFNSGNNTPSTSNLSTGTVTQSATCPISN